MTRISSTALTGGIGNGVVSTIESLGSIVLSVMAILVPFLTVALVSVLLIFVFRKGLQTLAMRKQSQ